MKKRLQEMSREEKIALLQMLEEKERRAREERTLLDPHAGQLKVILSRALERYLFPGNGYGKTALLVNEMWWDATGHNPFTDERTPVPIKAALVVATSKDVEDVVTELAKWHPLKEDQLHKRGRPHVSQITWDNGSSVTILTHEVSPLSLEGSQWTHLYFNEPPPKEVFIALYRGGRIKNRPLQVFMAGTPIAASWLRTDIYEPWVEGRLKHVECFQGTTHENAHNLGDGFIERFSAHLSEKERLIRLEGHFFDMDGLALAHLLKPDVHIVSNSHPWDATNPCVLVMDPHPSKAHNAVLLGVDGDNQLYVVEEYKEKAVARDFMESLIELGWFSQYRVTDVVFDSLGSGDTTSGEGFKSFGKVVNEVLEAHGLRHRARATRYDEKNDEEFIERVRDALLIPEKPNNFGQKLPKLRFYERCRGSYHDVRTVQWYEDKQAKENKPKLDIRKKDYLSCIKYALATNLYHAKPTSTSPHFYRRSAYGVSMPSSRRASQAARKSVIK
jgi:hypothetical protein